MLNVKNSTYKNMNCKISFPIPHTSFEVFKFLHEFLRYKRHAALLFYWQPTQKQDRPFFIFRLWQMCFHDAPHHLVRALWIKFCRAESWEARQHQSTLFCFCFHMNMIQSRFAPQHSCVPLILSIKCPKRVENFNHNFSDYKCYPQIACFDQQAVQNTKTIQISVSAHF